MLATPDSPSRKSTLLRPFILAGTMAVGLFVRTPHTQAATLSWDGTNTNGSQADGGAGTWDTNLTGNWWNGVANVVWPATGTDNDAVFAGTAGTVTIAAGGVTVNDITVSTAGYTFSGAGTITLNGTTPTFNVETGTTILGAGTATILDGTAGLTKTGAGTLSLTGSAAHTVTGGVNVNGGTLSLALSNLAGTTPANLLPASNALSFSNGGKFQLTGKGSSTGSQTFASTTVSSGTSTITLTSNGSTNTTLQLGSVSHTTGGILNLSLASGFAVTLSGIEKMRVSNTASRFLGAWALTGDSTSSSTRFAYVDATGQLRNETGASTGTNWSAVIDTTKVFTVGANVTLAADASAHGLQINPTAGTIAVTLAAQTVTTNGILNITTVGGGFVFSGATGNGGIVVGSENELVVAGNGNLRFSVPVKNGVGGNSNLTFAGGGTLFLDVAPSTYTGLTTINSGTVTLQLANILHSASGIVVNGTGTLNYADFGTPTLLPMNQSVNSVKLTSGTITGGTGTLTSATAFDVQSGTVSGILAGTAGLNKTTAGTVTLNKANVYSGNSTITGGTLQLGIANALHSSSGIVVNGGALNLTTFNQSVASVTLTNGTISGTTGTLTSAAAFELQNGSASAILAGSAGVHKSTAGTVILTGANTYTGGTTIDAGTLQFGTGATAAVGGGAIVNNGTLVINASNAISLTGGISGSGNVSLLGTGTTSIGGTNTYLGATSVAAGRVNLDGTFTSNISLASGANFGGEGSTTGSLTIAGTTTLFFDPTTPAHFTAGSINLSGATITLGPSVNTTGTGIVVLESGSVITTSGGTSFLFAGRGTSHLSVNQKQLLFDFAAASLKWKGGAGTPGTLWDLQTTANWTNAGTPDVFFSGDDVTFDDTASSFTVAVQGGPLAPGNITFDNSANDYAISGNLGGTGALVKNGTRTASLSGANTYSGGTTINAGILQLGDGVNATGSVAGAIVNNATLATNFGANNATVANSISGTGTLRQAGAGTVTLTGANSYDATLIDAGSLQIGSGGTAGSLGAGAVTNNGVLIFNRSDSFTVANAISGTGSVTKLGAGTVSLTGANSYGTTLISAGILQVSTGGTLGSGTVTDNATLAFNRTDSFTFGNVVEGTGAVTKAGAGTVILTGANSYSGTTTVSGGVLNIRHNAALGSAGAGAAGSGTTVANGAALELQGGITVTDEALTLTGSGIVVAGTGTGALRNISGNNTWTGKITLVSNANLNRIQADADLLTLSGTISGATGSDQLVFQGAGNITNTGVISGAFAVTSSSNGGDGATRTLSGANTYTGKTNINGGTLNVSSLNSVVGGTASSNLGAPTSAVNGTISMGSIEVNASLRYTGAGETTDRVVNLAGTTGGATLEQSGTGLLKFTSNFTAVTAVGGGSKTLTLQGSTAGSGEIAGAIVDHTSVNRTGVTKAGTGQWTLSGANLYTGATIVNGGTLLVSGSIESTVVNVNNGGTLGGTNGRLGTVATTVTIGAGGTLAPGSGIGALNVGNAGTGNSVVFSGATGNLATLSIELDAMSNASDTLNISGNLDLSSAFDQLALTLLNGTLTEPHTYTIATYTGALFGTFDSTPNLPVGAEINYGTGTNSAITVTMVPEPGTVTSLLAGLGLLLGRRRRQS